MRFTAMKGGECETIQFPIFEDALFRIIGFRFCTVVHIPFFQLSRNQAVEKFHIGLRLYFSLFPHDKLSLRNLKKKLMAFFFTWLDQDITLKCCFSN